MCWWTARAAGGESSSSDSWTSSSRGGQSRQFVRQAGGRLGKPERNGAEIAGRQVEGRHRHPPFAAAPIAAPVRCAADRDQVVVAAAVEQLLVKHGPGRDHLDHFAARDALACARQRGLLAHRHPAARLEQARDVGTRGVMGHAAHRHAVSLREGDFEQRRRLPGIGVEHFVEVAQAKEQNGIPVAALQLPVLDHHRGGGFRGHERERQPRRARGGTPSGPGGRAASR